VRATPPNQRLRASHGGPAFAAPSLWTGGNTEYSLTNDDGATLATLAGIASISRIKQGETIYEEGARANSVFNIIAGVAKSYRTLPDRTQHVVGFLFPGDIFGLSEGGNYVNAAAAVTDVCLYRIPAVALEARLRRNPGLDFRVICRLCHELREAQRHALVLTKKRAAAKLALFLQMLEMQRAVHGSAGGEITLPMSRTEIGAYLALSPEAVSRALRELVTRGAIDLRGRRQVMVRDRALLDATIGESGL
jgi:CRP/FNR family transcriptional regulator